MMKDDMLQTASVILLYDTIAYFLVVKYLCLLMSGDVELNPGPLDQGRPLKSLLYVNTLIVYDSSTLEGSGKGHQNVYFSKYFDMTLSFHLWGVQKKI